MSCYIVPTKHISAIVRYAADQQLQMARQGGGVLYEAGQEAAICALLYGANVRSVNARYNETTAEDGVTYDAEAPQLTAIEAIKASQGLAYQCDNWDGFDGSPADRFLKEVQRHAITQLPGYHAASWSIE
jgi:hypothetical protein